MKSYTEITDRIKTLYNTIKEKVKKFKFKRDYLVFMAFFILSLVFWLLKSLSKTYETDIDFQVRFSNKPRGVIFERELPSSIQLDVTDAGFQLLQNTLTPNIKTLYVNLANILQRGDRKLSEGHYFILTRDYRSQIERALASTTKLNLIQPDTLHIVFSKQIQKKVPVRLLANVSPGRQRILSGKISFQPDSVTIFGAGSIVDTIRAVYTNYQDFKNLQDTLRRNIGLKEIEGVDLASKRVNIEIPVEMFTEKVLDIPVTSINLPDSLRLRSFPGIVKVSFFVGVSKFSKVGEDDFRVFVDFKTLKEKVSGNVPLSYDTEQKWISNIKVSPEKIDYLLELKQ